MTSVPPRPKRLSVASVRRERLPPPQRVFHYPSKPAHNSGRAAHHEAESTVNHVQNTVENSPPHRVFGRKKQQKPSSFLPFSQLFHVEQLPVPQFSSPKSPFSIPQTPPPKPKPLPALQNSTVPTVRRKTLPTLEEKAERSSRPVRSRQFFPVKHNGRLGFPSRPLRCCL